MSHLNFNPRSPYGERLGGKLRPGVELLISIHAPHTGSDKTAVFKTAKQVQFQSTLPIRGATAPDVRSVSGSLISIHAPHTGSDSSARSALSIVSVFQSTLPIRGATSFMDAGKRQRYFNPRSPYGERHILFRFPLVTSISIHAPHTGSDFALVRRCHQSGISIHAPHTGSDGYKCKHSLCMVISIHADGSGHNLQSHFNPRSPYGERPTDTQYVKYCFRFQSTLPYGERPVPVAYLCGSFQISIHAPHTGSDDTSYPILNANNISIHAPHTGSDQDTGRKVRISLYFNPRSPYGERPERSTADVPQIPISIHAPHTGSDASFLPDAGGCLDFNPRSPYGERPAWHLD